MSRPARATTRRVALLLCLLSLAAGVGAQSGSPAPAPTPPYRPGIQDPLDFRGPGRDEPEPDVREVVLGWFGPGTPDHPAFGTLWRGATLALEEENATGGYRGAAAASPGASVARPFRLEPVWSESPWQAGTAALLRLVYERRAWAVIGGVDGTTTHLALQVALKAHLLLLSPASTDATTDRANVPWLFSLAPSDDALAAAAVFALAREAPEAPFAIAVSADHDGHAALAAFRRELGRHRLVPAAVVEYTPAPDDLPAAARRVVDAHPRVVIVLGPARGTGGLAAALRRARFAGTVLGSATAAGRAFRSAAGDAADGVVAATAMVPDAASGPFAAAYQRRWGEPPDANATNGYDAVKLVVAAIRRAGLNRARIRDAVRGLAPWSGAGGPVEWDALGRNQRPVVTGAWTRGRFLADDRRSSP